MKKCENCKATNILKTHTVKGIDEKSIKLCSECFELFKMMKNYLLRSKTVCVINLYDTMIRLYSSVHCSYCRYFDHLRKDKCLERKWTGVGVNAKREHTNRYPQSFAVAGCGSYVPSL